jgi:hypothetical protein
MPSSVQFGWALLKEKTKLTLAVKQAHLKVFCSELGHPANIETRARRGARKERENDGFAFNHALIDGLSDGSLNGLGAGGRCAITLMTPAARHACAAKLIKDETMPKFTFTAPVPTRSSKFPQMAKTWC